MASKFLSRLFGTGSSDPTGQAPAAGPSDDSSIAGFFAGDHRACDTDWAMVEDAVNRGDDEGARRAYAKFAAEVRRHLDMEEDVIFPALEDATGMHDMGPTVVMRMEHRQMRGLLDAMDAAIAAGDMDELTGQGDTLLMLTQQHNIKEEGMLYPMADNAIGDQWPALREALRKYE